jgi:alpha,alpha-trehalase
LDDSLELDQDFTLRPVYFGDEVPYPEGNPVPDKRLRGSLERPQSSAEWFARAARRKQLIDHYCWNEGKGLFYDYDTSLKKQSNYETVTMFWAMWAGVASEAQAAKLV